MNRFDLFVLCNMHVCAAQLMSSVCAGVKTKKGEQKKGTNAHILGFKAMYHNACRANLSSDCCCETVGCLHLCLEVCDIYRRLCAFEVAALQSLHDVTSR